MSIGYPCVYWSDGKCKKFSDDKYTGWCVKGLVNMKLNPTPTESGL